MKNKKHKKGLLVGILGSIAGILLAGNLYLTNDLIELHHKKKIAAVPQHLRAVDVSDLEQSLFGASGINTLHEQKQYANKIDKICSKIKAKKNFSQSNIYEKHKIVYDLLYEVFFKDNFVVLDPGLKGVLSKDPKGNCVSFSGLYLLVANNLNLDCDIMMFYSHFFPVFNLGDKAIEIETTEPYGKGFDGNINKDEPGLIEVGIDYLTAAFYSNKGKLLITQGKFDEAESMFRKGIDVCDDFCGNYSNLSGLYLVKYRNIIPDCHVKDIIKYSKKAIKLFPYSLQSYNHLAEIYLYKEDLKKAGVNLKISEFLMKRVDHAENDKQCFDNVYALYKRKAPDFDLDSVEVPYSVKTLVGMK